MIKKIALALYALLIVCMAAATIVEKFHGTPYAHQHIYSSWWFTTLWALLAASGILYFIRRRVRRPHIVGIHSSLVIILIGALLTHLTAWEDKVHLRVGEPAMLKGYQIELHSFDIDYHSGTTTAADYRSAFTLTDKDKTVEGIVSMNNIFSYRSMRLYQSSYDADMRGSTLSVNIDPWGIPITYVGYALLFLSLIWMLIDKKGTFRRLISTLVVLAIVGFANAEDNNTPQTLPKDVASSFGRLYILHNGRICPFQTYAFDLTKKVYGSTNYKGLTPEQVVTGWMFFSEEWNDEPFIKIKNGAMKSRLMLPDYRSINDFFNPEMGGYTIGPYVQEYYAGRHDAFHKQVAETDNKIQLIMELRRGSSLNVFPHVFENDYGRTHTDAAIKMGDIRWYAPTDGLHYSIETDRATFIRSVFALLYEKVHEGDYDAVDEILQKIVKFQHDNAGTSLPSKAQTWAERVNNTIPFATILFIVNLTLGLVLIVVQVIHRNIASCKPSTQRNTTIRKAVALFMLLSFLALTFLLIVRFIITGNIPMSNGYETTLVIAWLVQLITLIVHKRAPILLIFGFLLSGFFLLVSHINQMNPAIGHLMPVLNSPLLSVHVSFIMVSYALLSLTFIISLTAIIRFQLREGKAQSSSDLIILSQLFLYPAITTLGIGIFVGAIWANVSWGRYWSWDPKEVWALITLMVYVIPLHKESLPAFNKPLTYHIFIVCAFLTVLMTYFGVNYLLGGMHSYA